MADRILVTGGSGFVGSRLIERLKSTIRDDATIVSVGRSAVVGRNIPSVVHEVIDLGEPGACQDLISRWMPTQVYHLAAQPSTAPAAGCESQFWKDNFSVTMALAMALNAVGSARTFVFASTAQVYGDTFKSKDVVSEDDPAMPSGTYGRTKLAAEMVLRDILPATMNCVVARVFNSVGPGQSADFVVAAFASQIAKIEKGLAPPVVTTGNLSPERDFLDIRDAVDGLMNAASAGSRLGRYTIFNIASGKLRSISSILESMIAMSEVKVTTEIDFARQRQGEVARICGSSQKLNEVSGWRPQVEWETTLADTLDWWRATVGVSAPASPSTN